MRKETVAAHREEVRMVKRGTKEVRREGRRGFARKASRTGARAPKRWRHWSAFPSSFLFPGGSALPSLLEHVTTPSSPSSPPPPPWRGTRGSGRKKTNAPDGQKGTRTLQQSCEPSSVALSLPPPCTHASFLPRRAQKPEGSRRGCGRGKVQGGVPCPLLPRGRHGRTSSLGAQSCRRGAADRLGVRALPGDGPRLPAREKREAEK